MSEFKVLVICFLLSIVICTGLFVGWVICVEPTIDRAAASYADYINRAIK